MVTSASIYLAGGVFFSTGGYGSVLQAINEPAGAGARWRWWSYRPMELGWLAAFVLFCGTLAFGISLVSAFIEGLSRRVRRPCTALASKGQSREATTISL